mmetsp:Transcript_24882/g.44319  ORF Transcript_24882/g.44319 Transcript_24882/m.44319 type:complete len:200 (-) Transcript_24882:1111-1710(-)
MGMSRARASWSSPIRAFRSTPAEETSTNSGRGSLYPLTPPSSRRRNSPGVKNGLGRPLNSNREYTRPTCRTWVGSRGGPEGSKEARFTQRNSCQGRNTSTHSPSTVLKHAWYVLSGTSICSSVLRLSLKRCPPPFTRRRIPSKSSSFRSAGSVRSPQKPPPSTMTVPDHTALPSSPFVSSSMPEEDCPPMMTSLSGRQR